MTIRYDQKEDWVLFVTNLMIMLYGAMDLNSFHSL